MLIAFETPSSLLELQNLADFDFLLAHRVLSGKDGRPVSTRMCILDNSCNELGDPLPIDKLLSAANLVNPEFVCAPDFLGDGEKTLFSLKDFEARYSSKKVFPILQASSFKEASSYAKSIYSLGYRRIAVPYDITCSKEADLAVMRGNRTRVVDILANTGFTWIHLLGMNLVSELHNYAFLPQVKTLDTGSPITNGLEYRHFGENEQLPKTRMLDLDYEHPTKEQLFSICYNIAYLRMIVNREELNA